MFYDQIMLLRSLHGLVDIVIAVVDLHGHVEGVTWVLQWKVSVMNWCTNICIQILSDKLVNIA